MNVLAWLFASITAFLSSGSNVQSSTPPGDSKGPVARGECPTNGCGLNGTRMTGRAIELGDSVDHVTLASGETIMFR